MARSPAPEDPLKRFRTGNFPALAVGLLLFALLCWIGTMWALKLFGPRAPLAPAEVVADPRAGLDLRAAGRLFGSAAGPSAPVAASVNVQVLGVASDPQRAAVVLAVDGKPARPYAVGDELSSGIRLVDVRPDTVVIDRNGQRVELAAPPRPSLSVLTGGQAAGAGGPPASGPPPLARPMGPEGPGASPFSPPVQSGVAPPPGGPGPQLAGPSIAPPVPLPMNPGGAPGVPPAAAEGSDTNAGIAAAPPRNPTQ